ncbi:hypothetical protein JHK87_025587 [Glycine soja]|nr:hypothetical protein JHK87_025587 [Glycine soja]
MGFLQLLEVASAPVIQVLLISAVGAFMATDYCDNLLSAEFRKSLNKIVFFAFTPSLIFASFSKNVSLEDMISWWFMPVNIGCTFLIGGILGWILVKVLKPNLKVQGLIIASCSTGNMGNLPVVIIPAICDQKGGPFGAPDDCRNRALSYSFCSLALGGVFIWTYTYQLMQNTSLRYKAFEAAEILKIPSKDIDANAEARLLKQNDGYAVDTENQINDGNSCPNPGRTNVTPNNCYITETEFILYRDGTIPCITVLLGGNLTQGMRSSSIQPLILICIIIARLFLLPAIGFFVVKAAANFGFLPLDPLFQYVLVMQYAMPPAMNISTMAQLFDVGTEEFSVILLWTYGASTIALTLWSTFLIWIFS